MSEFNFGELVGNGQRGHIPFVPTDPIIGIGAGKVGGGPPGEINSLKNSIRILPKGGSGTAPPQNPPPSK